MIEDEMVGWQHRFKGHEFEQTPGDSEGQGSLACCSPWGHKEFEIFLFIHCYSNTLNSLMKGNKMSPKS